MTDYPRLSTHMLTCTTNSRRLSYANDEDTDVILLLKGRHVVLVSAMSAAQHVR